MAQNKLALRRKNIDNEDRLSSSQMVINSSLIPQTDDNFDLGHPASRWRSIYVASSIINDGYLELGGQLYESSEHISVAGGANSDPSASVVYTYLTTTGSGTATGTLANGTAENQRKVIIGENLTADVPYALTVTNCLDAATGVITSEVVYLINNGDRAELVWDNSRSTWVLNSVTTPDIATVYVRDTGSDTNGGLSSTTAVATLQRAAEIVCAIGWNTYGVINVSGTFTEQSLNVPNRSSKGSMQYPLFITGDAPVLQDSMTVTAVTNVNGSNANQTIITATGSGSITTGQLNGMILRLTSGATSGYEAMIADHQASGTTHTIRIGMYAGGTNQALTIGVGTTFGVYAHDAIFNISAGSSPQWLLNSMKAGIRRIRFNLNGSAANTRVSIFSDNSIHLQAVSLVTATGSSNSTNFNVTTANFSSGLNGGIMAEGVYSPAGAGEVTGIAAIGLNGTAKMTVTMSSPFQRFYATASRYATWNFSALSCTRLFGGHFYNSSIQVSADIETFSTGIEIDASDAPIVATANTSTYLGAFLQTSGTATLASWSSIVTGGLCPASWYGVVSYGNMTLMTACRITGFTAGGLLVAAGGSVRLQGNSGNLFIGNNTGSGVTVQHNGTLAVYGRTSNGLTGTSNTQYGVSVSAGGRLVVLLPGTSTTITGTLGDVQFGSQVLAWASVPASSAIEALGQIDVSGQVNTTADYRINASRVLTANSTQLLVGRSIASAPSGTLLTVVGNGAGAALTTGTGHTAVGANALALMTSGNSCVGIGDNCLAKATGQFNTGVGSSAGFNVTTGGSNVLIGDQAGTAITTGSHTTAVGSNAGSAISTNSNSVYVGWNAGNTATGGDNVLIGAAAGSGLTSGTNNTLLGVTAGVSSGTLSDCIVIGANAQAQNSGELALGSLGNPLTTALTVGAAGAASGLPASPDAYLQVRINGTLYKVPLFAV